MNRVEFLDRVKNIVTKERNTSYGEPENNFAEIAKLWSWYLGEEISALQVSHLMMLLKIARIRGNQENLDNYHDIAGYAACGSELLAKKEKQSS